MKISEFISINTGFAIMEGDAFQGSFEKQKKICKLKIHN